MKLTILGSGTSVPHPERASPAHWFETPNGTILLDISADAPHRMAQEALDWTQSRRHLDQPFSS
jgi:ribonuclease BN (tRNA processing enzyme)